MNVTPWSCRRFVLVWLAMLAASIGVWAGVVVGIAHADTPIRAHGGRTPCASVVACRKVVRWNVKERRHLQHQLAVRWHPDVVAAIRLASNISGVSFARLWTISGCESRHNPLAVTGQFDGLFQLGAYHRSFPDLRGLSVFNPYANAMHAALFIARHGESQWACRSTGRVVY